jgi:outer membrane protein assembly factor BamB
MSEMTGGKPKAGTPGLSRLRALTPTCLRTLTPTCLRTLTPTCFRRLSLARLRTVDLPLSRVLHPTRLGAPQAAGGGLSRRTALLLPFALAGCDTIDSWFATKKDLLPGKREPIGALRSGFNADEAAPMVQLPPAVRDMAWPQAAGGPTHLMGNLSANATLKQAWTADVGEGGGYRRQILAQPVVADGVVFAMDSDSVVTAFNLASGAKLWRTPTVDEDLDSSNVGGGLCWAAGTLYAVNGMAELLALDTAKGAVKWRHSIEVPARSAPTVADGKIFLTTIDSKLLALSADDGHPLWSYQATQTTTTLLGSPAPAFDQGIVVAGFASGELAAVRADSGNVIWTDGLGLAEGQPGIVEFLAIRGEPVIANNLVFATGLGGVTIAADILTGRRAWERRVPSENTPCMAGEWMFLISTDQQIGAINVNDARISWVASLPKWENPDKKKDPITWFGPVLAGGRLIVVGTNRSALALDPASGATVTTYSLSDVAAPLTPVVVDGTMLTVTNDGKLTAWR